MARSSVAARSPIFEPSAMRAVDMGRACETRDAREPLQFGASAHCITQPTGAQKRQTRLIHLRVGGDIRIPAVRSSTVAPLSRRPPSANAALCDPGGHGM